MSVWNWIQRFVEYRIYKRKRVSALIIDETVIQIGNRQYWLWFCIESIHKSMLGIYLTKARNRLVTEKFSRSLIDKYAKHTVYTDGGTWYPQACKISHIKT